ncbi:hypothetical protein [Sphingomonas jatrophae]|uniref:Uncharacterized protein n=1 Tax=Sphingomonas jatrophae TaxID=1166337 RepID=A0A1I6KXL1_9SPHN|nr:hypothetical protein [Sphingomonas jatrophae]SFR95952.1 hypothetical protein SAMN05192580_1890 [Sphingomonas jatrophae]
MTDKVKMPVDGGGNQSGDGKDVDSQMASGGQSQGKAYPNDAGGEGFDGGQSGKAYHGANQLGDETADEARDRKD